MPKEKDLPIAADIAKFRVIQEDGKSAAAPLTEVIKAVGGTEYVLPRATASTLGGVKIGGGLDIAEDGTLSATGGGGGGGYVLPKASASVLGGIKVGNNLTMREDGTLDAMAGGGSGGGESAPYVFDADITDTAEQKAALSALFEAYRANPGIQVVISMQGGLTRVAAVVAAVPGEMIVVIGSVITAYDSVFTVTVFLCSAVLDEAGRVGEIGGWGETASSIGNAFAVVSDEAASVTTDAAKIAFNRKLWSTLIQYATHPVVLYVKLNGVKCLASFSVSGSGQISLTASYEYLFVGTVKKRQLIISADTSTDAVGTWRYIDE